MERNMGLLPEPERSTASFVTSTVVNLLILALAFYVGMAARHVLAPQRYEQTTLIIPADPPPAVKLKIPPPLDIPEPKLPEVKFDPPKIAMPRIEPKPDLKPIEMESKVEAPVVKAMHPSVVLAQQPKAALPAAMPAQSPQVNRSTATVRLGESTGVTPNPNATRPATAPALGGSKGVKNGPAVAANGVVGPTGISNGPRSGPGGGGGFGGANNRVAPAVIPSMVAIAAPPRQYAAARAPTNLEILSRPAVQYTAEARQLRVQGDVVLRVTFTAGGQVVVQGVLQSLGHGLDEEARRVAQQIRFKPATRDGQATDLTTNVTVTFQLA